MRPENLEFEVSLGYIVKPCLNKTKMPFKDSYLFRIFIEDWGLNSGLCMLTQQTLYHSSHTSSPFCSGYSRNRVLRIICPGWPQVMILLISASQVAGL
jgi:hypothetical protein